MLLPTAQRQFSSTGMMLWRISSFMDSLISQLVHINLKLAQSIAIRNRFLNEYTVAADRSLKSSDCTRTATTLLIISPRSIFNGESQSSLLIHRTVIHSVTNHSFTYIHSDKKNLRTAAAPLEVI